MQPERISKAWRGVAHNPGGGAGGRGGRGGGGGLGLGLGCSATFAANRRIGTFRSQLGNFSSVLFGPMLSQHPTTLVA